MLSVESTLYNILKQIEKQCEEDSDPSSLLYCDALLFSAVHYLHGYLRALLGKREDPGPRSYSTEYAVLFIETPRVCPRCDCFVYQSSGGKIPNVGASTSGYDY